MLAVTVSEYLITKLFVVSPSNMFQNSVKDFTELGV